MRSLALLVVLAGCDPDPRSGGPATVFETGRAAFSRPAPVLNRLERRAFAVGNAFFRTNWVVSGPEGRDGLGPLFNARSCSACHLHDGRGRLPRDAREKGTGFLVRLAVADASGAWGPHPELGGQIQDDAIPGARPEPAIAIRRTPVAGRFPDGDTYRLTRVSVAVEGLGDDVVLSLRVAPHIVGQGLLEAVPAASVLARADPDDGDGDGISGRARLVDGALGRFGWKAAQPTVKAQVAVAFREDIGITADEIDDHKLARVAFYARTLAVPARRRVEETRRGEGLFREVGCAGCHVPALTTGTFAGVPALSGVTIRAYTDLLLHDMGPDLADGGPTDYPLSREWRTPPLWGIGLVATVSPGAGFLHDGRAATLLEAILWHGGEAAAARDAFKKLSREERKALLAFLESL